MQQVYQLISAILINKDTFYFKLKLNVQFNYKKLKSQMICDTYIASCIMWILNVIFRLHNILVSVLLSTGTKKFKTMHLLLLKLQRNMTTITTSFPTIKHHIHILYFLCLAIYLYVYMYLRNAAALILSLLYKDVQLEYYSGYSVSIKHT